MKKLLKNSIQEKFEDIQLDVEQLERLSQLQSGTSTAKPDTKKEAENDSSYRRWLSLASAAMVLMFALGFLMPDMLKQSNENLVAEIAAEVVKNHLHRKPLEVKASKLDGVRSYFTRLDFEPVESNYLFDRGLAMLGGRYCSIQGVTAAQLRFKAGEEDDINTLYQVGYDPAVFKQLPNYDKAQAPVVSYSKGIKVTIWVEKGVLFALTENP